MSRQAISGRIGIGVILLTVVGCATIDQLAPPVEELAPSTAELDDHALALLRRGRELYVTSCARCHSPESVTAYTREQWDTILPRMAEEAGLSTEEQFAVKEYVLAVLRVQARLPSVD